MLSFFLSTQWLIRFAGYPECGLLKEKLLHFEKHKDEYDLFFVGTSRVYRGIIPPLFDAEMTALGLPLRSFNFAVAGMKQHEANALIRRVLAMKPARLRWVVAELGEWDPGMWRGNRFKSREIFWHDASETLSVMRSTLLLDQPLAIRAGLLLTHALHFAARGIGAGRGGEVARSLLTGDDKRAEPEELPQQGFETYSERAYERHYTRRLFLSRLDEYRAMVGRLSAANAEAVAPTSYRVDALEDQIAMIRHAGAEPVYLITPTPRATPGFYGLHREGRLSALLAFNNPQAYPDLFAIERRFDREHLTQEGAERFTRLLAARFAAEVARRGPPEHELVADARP